MTNPPTTNEPTRPTPITQQWWFWALLAALLAAVVVLAITWPRDEGTTASPAPTTQAPTTPPATTTPTGSPTATTTQSPTGEATPTLSVPSTMDGNEVDGSASEELTPIGDIVTSGPLDLLVSNATFGEPSGDGTRTVTVDVAVTNHDPAALPLVPDQFVVVTPTMSGDRVDFARHQVDAELTAAAGTTLFDEPVAPGQTARGQLVYAVPADAPAYALAFRGTTDASIVGVNLGG